MPFLEDREVPYFIAEVGTNHLNDLNHTLKLVREFANRGANGIKFQLFTAEGLYSHNTPIFPGEKEMPYSVAKKHELPKAFLPEIKSTVEEHNADFICSIFSIEDVDLLEKMNVCSYKIASSEINDVELIKSVAMTGKPIFLSLGMAKLKDIELALETIHACGPSEVVLLQCTSLYPTPLEEVNLNAMKTIENTFGCMTGFSDHTLGFHISLAAVALGAKVIEKHVTLDREAIGPDHFFALQPEEFARMVTWARDIEKSLGLSRKIITKGEFPKRHLSQRSIVTKRKISKGEMLCKENLTTKRPGYGLPPAFLPIIIGHYACREIARDEVVKWEDVLA